MFFRYPLTLFLALLLSGCAATTSDLPSRILFPPPPEEPRLEFIGAYFSSDDMKVSKSDQFRKSFLGTAGNDGFSSPSGVAVDSQGLVYVSDALDRNVKVMDFSEKTITFRFKSPEFSRPNGLAFDREGRLYVADTLRSRVMVFAPGAEKSERTFTHTEMLAPAYVAINDRLGRVYVSDGKAQRVFVYGKDGQYLFQFGAGSGNPEVIDNLYGPQGLAVAPDDTVYVPEIFNARVSVFDADGKYLRSFGARGDSFWTFDHPKALAFDNEGHLYITDSRRGKVVVYTTDGQLLMVLGGETSLDLTGFGMPVAIAFDARNRFYVADSFGKKVSVWQYIDEAYKKVKPVTAAELQEIEDFFKRREKLAAP